ncbi:MAG: voltage-gated sodium channel [Hyphomicrobiaceae bacterium]
MSETVRGFNLAGLEWLVTHPKFERFVIVVIVVNAIALGLETSTSVMSSIGGLLQWLDFFIICFFVFEVAARMIVHKTKFWRDPWSLFDTAVVAITLMPATGNFSVLRALRILRVLRIVSALPSIRRVVTGLLNAIPGMSSILFLLTLINYIFAVLTTKLYAATHPEFFGTIGASFFTLFQIMTLEGWSGEVVRPVMKDHPYAWAVFVPYIIVVTFAVLNLFIGIVVDAMQSQSDEERDEESEREYKHIISEIHILRDEIREMRASDTKPT